MEIIDPMVIPQLPKDRFSCLMFPGGVGGGCLLWFAPVWGYKMWIEWIEWTDGGVVNGETQDAGSVGGYWKEAKGARHKVTSQP